MKPFQRRAGILLVLALLTGTGILSAQDAGNISMVGSGIVVPVLEAIAEASEAALPLDIQVTGTNSGFEQFCQGQADIMTATRTITAAEDVQCSENNVDYAEFLIGHDIVAFVARPDANFAQCLTNDNLTAIFAPSAQGQTTNWQQVDTENPDVPLLVFVPQTTTSTYTILDNLVPGDGIRADASVQTSDDAIINAVSANPGAIGVVSFNAAIAAGDSVKILEVNTNDAVGCTVPSAENVEARAYTAAAEFFAYVSRSSLEKPGMNEFMTFATSPQSASAIETLGFTPPGETAYANNQTSLEGDGDTRPFSSTASSFQIPLDVAGMVNIAGATSGRQYLSEAATAFQGLYPQVTIDVQTTGQPAGVRQLCNGEIDIAVVDSDLSAEQSQNCAANNIETLPIDLGKQAVILVANASSSQLACLTTDQLRTTWEANSRETVTSWNMVDNSFPEQPITLFAPPAGDSMTDLLMTSVAGTAIPARDDIELHNDPLYRAAATANVEGALTYMTWADYQRVLANGQERIQLVGVDGGNGCVIPSEETITNGSYPLTRSATLLVNTSSLDESPVQSFLWYLASDENYGLLGQSGLIGVSFGSLPPLRDTLEKAFLDAAQAEIETTPEATAEATPEATPGS